MNTRKKPVLIERDDSPLNPADAPPVPDVHPTPALTRAIRLGARRPSLLSRAFWWLLGMLLSVSIMAWGWDLLRALLGQNSLLGYLITGLFAVFLLVLLLIIVRELAGFARLKRLDRVRKSAEEALATGTASQAHPVVAALDRLYANRPDMDWARQNLAENAGQELDADAVLARAEQALIVPLDQAATAEIEAATRQVAMVTALIPLALADLLTALAANLRMIRRIAEIYGGRTGRLGSWRLTRAVLAHLLATGVVAVGDDLIGSVAGGSVLSKFSRRFGEGLINGALTARVGVAAMEVCRPLPFLQARRPSVTAILKRAVTGLFASEK